MLDLLPYATNPVSSPQPDRYAKFRAMLCPHYVGTNTGAVCGL